MASPKIYQKNVEQLLDKAVKAIRAWESSDGPNVNFNGEVVKAVAPALDLAFRKLIDGTADEKKEVEEGAKAIVMALDEFALKYARWLRAVAVQAASPRGSAEMWEAWSRVLVAAEPPRNEVPRSVKFLVDTANAPRSQIARLYGWFVDGDTPDSPKIPDEVKVQEEYEKPGTHFKADEWKSPSYQAYWAEIQAAWKDRQGARKVLFPDMQEDAAASAAEAPKPPSLDEMVNAGAPAAQIARVHGMKLEEAEALLRSKEEENALAAQIGAKG